MVYYKDNPNLKELAVVTTFDGKKEYRRNCKFLKEKYYVINRDCFEVNGIWCPIDGGNIVFDHETQTYTFLRNNPYIVKGVVKTKEGHLEVGYFTHIPWKNVRINSEVFGDTFAISEDILGKEWFEDLKCNIIFNGSEMSSRVIARRKIIDNHENPANRGYNIEDNTFDFPNKVKSYESYNTQISRKVKKLSKYVGDLTFGFEFELAKGNLPEHLQHKYGVVPCRDGSLNGGIELVTIPMSGAKGIQTIVDLADSLKVRGLVDLNCSLHIHFGNIGLDKLSTISLYRLCRNIQEELFTMFPYYKTNHNGIKQKNYTKKLNRLNIGVLKDFSKEAYESYLLDSWNKLFNFYSEKLVSLDTFNKKTREHPTQNKWNRHSR